MAPDPPSGREDRKGDAWGGFPARPDGPQLKRGRTVNAIDVARSAVTGEELRPGMVIRKDGDKVPHTVGSYTGHCSKGRHFGNGCYDRIGRWVWIHKV